MVLTVQEDESYRIGPRGRARVVLVEKTETFADWQTANFPDFDGSLESFANADSGQTGISHLLRYAYGMDPSNPDRARLPKFYLRNGRLTVDLFRNPAATDIEYRVAISSDLDGWDDSQVSVEEVNIENADGDAGASCFQSRETTDTEEKLFMLIEVKKKP